jgi:Acyl-protein synthetase, LuxE
MSRESTALHERVRRFIEGRGEPFDQLAVAIAAYQHAFVPAVRRLFDSAGLDPSTLTQAACIPAVPTDAFRYRRIAAHPASEDARVFRTSGTTGGAEKRGAHSMRDVATYELGAMSWGKHMLFPDRDHLHVVALLGDELAMPDSSLTFMVARFAEVLDHEASFHWDGERLDMAAVIARLRALDGPVLVAGTSFAFVHLLDAMEEPLALAERSRVMQTGGFKGRSRSVDAGELRRLIAGRFELPEAAVVAEYGMTELSSQLYQGTLRHALLGDEAPPSASAYRAPPWLRVDAVDPIALTALPAGEVGLGRFVDLANVDSAVAIQTADRVRVVGDGWIELLGRAPGANPRGCSLALEHLLEEA